MSRVVLGLDNESSKLSLSLEQLKQNKSHNGPNSPHYRVIDKAPDGPGCGYRPAPPAPASAHLHLARAKELLQNSCGLTVVQCGRVTVISLKIITVVTQYSAPH